MSGVAPPLLILALLGGWWPFGHHAQSEERRYLIPAWHVDAVRDRFTERSTCRIYQGTGSRPTVSFARDSLAFAFGGSRNTLEADFRVDGGPVRSWTSVYPALIGSGATLPAKSMTDPTGGFVILPMAVLRGATTVTIRARPKDEPRTFSIAGLSDAIVAAQRLGCDAPYGFSRPL